MVCSSVVVLKRGRFMIFEWDLLICLMNLVVWFWIVYVLVLLNGLLVLM